MRAVGVLGFSDQGCRLMRRITLLDDEWNGLAHLAAVPRHRELADQEFGYEVVRFLVQKGLVAEDGQALVATAEGLAVLASSPPPSTIGVRVWIEPLTRA